MLRHLALCTLVRYIAMRLRASAIDQETAVPPASRTAALQLDNLLAAGDAGPTVPVGVGRILPPGCGTKL